MTRFEAHRIATFIDRSLGGPGSGNFGHGGRPGQIGGSGSSAGESFQRRERTESENARERGQQQRQYAQERAKAPHATFQSVMTGFGDPVALFNVHAPGTEHHGSTVTGDTLRKLGISVPKVPDKHGVFDIHGRFIAHTQQSARALPSHGDPRDVHRQNAARLLARVRAYQHVHQAADAFVAKFTKLFADAFRNERNHVNRKELEAAIALKDADKIRKLLPNSIYVDPHELLQKTFNLGGVNAASILPRRSRAAMMHQLARYAARTPIGFSFDASNPRAVDWARQHAADLISGISKTTRDNIRDMIASSLESEDETTSTLADKILDAIGDDARAETIARTETIAAANAGQQEAWAQATEDGWLLGNEQQVWIVTPDDKLCDDCNELDGVTADLGEDFDGGEYGDVSGPPLHPNCRCVLGLET